MNALLQANDIVRRRWNRSGTVWKTLIIGAVIIMSIVGLAYFVLWSIVKLLKGLSSGVGTGGDYSLYFPKRRR